MRASDLQYNTDVWLRKLANKKLKVPEKLNYYGAYESIMIQEPFHNQVKSYLKFVH
jgi:hypothetical protein